VDKKKSDTVQYRTARVPNPMTYSSPNSLYSKPCSKPPPVGRFPSMFLRYVTADAFDQRSSYFLTRWTLSPMVNGWRMLSSHLSRDDTATAAKKGHMNATLSTSFRNEPQASTLGKAHVHSHHELAGIMPP
jgi:hypothetical protein